MKEAIRFDQINAQELKQRVLLQVPGVTRFSLEKSGVVYKADVSASRPEKKRFLAAAI